MTEFADKGPSVERLVEDQALPDSAPTSSKRKKNLMYLRKKRLGRIKRKKEEHKKLTRRERRDRLRERLSSTFRDEVHALKNNLLETQRLYAKECELSNYCWKKWKKENRIARQQRCGSIKRINKDNLAKGKTGSLSLGKGCFGQCIKMEYRGIEVAVKKFDTFVTVSSVLSEASVINQLDHPDKSNNLFFTFYSFHFEKKYLFIDQGICTLGLPLLFGVSVCSLPFMMVTQFHGINGKCVTLREAYKTKLLKAFEEWTNVFIEIAEALNYVHGKGLLHNNVKSDNVVVTHVEHYHPVLIDFGKCKKMENAKLYNLTKQEQLVYKQKYWHIAPELVKGTHMQSTKSDIFSYGVMMKSVSVSLFYKKLEELAQDCTHENPSNRPSLTVIINKLSHFIK